MRLWHIDLIKFLPRTQLIAQWRELNSIFAKQDKHILINYIYDYPKEYLGSYTISVLAEMRSRGYKVVKWDNLVKYFELDLNPSKLKIETAISELYNRTSYEGQYRFKEHDLEYLEICYYNLKEKHMRGQEDFSYKELDRIREALSRQCM